MFNRLHLIEMIDAKTARVYDLRTNGSINDYAVDFFDVGQACECDNCKWRAGWLRACGLRPGDAPSPEPTIHYEH